MKTVYTHINDGTDIRISKVMNTLGSMNCNIIFFGLGKNNNLSFPNFLVRKRYDSDRPSKFDVILFIFKLYLFILKNKPERVICVNEWLGLIILPLKAFVGFSLCLDLFDSVSERKGINKEGNSLYYRLLSQLYNFSTRIIVTDENREKRFINRFPNCKNKVLVVPNFPLKSNIVSTSKYWLGKNETSVKILFAGSVSHGRGIDTIRQAVSILNSKRVEVDVYIAGWLYDDKAKLLCEEAGFYYLGKLENSQYLSLAGQVDYIYMYYEPSNDNNLNASPNKIYDSIMVKTKVLFNVEISISNWILENKFGYGSKYNDYEALAKNIMKSSEWDSPSTSSFNWESLEGLINEAYVN